MKMRLAHEQRPDGIALVWSEGQTDTAVPVLAATHPVVLETVDADLEREERVEVGYDNVEQVSASELIGTAEVGDSRGVRVRVRDRWREVEDGWLVDRTLETLQNVPGAGVRLLLEVAPDVRQSASYEDFRYFAPAAMYDLNDLNRDHVDDYSDTQTLFYREDRLSAMTVLAHHAGTGRSFSISRSDVPEFDPVPERELGQTRYLQRTDIGSLGLFPSERDGEGCRLAGSYPFVERDRCHALVVSTRPAWGTFWPADQGESLTASYVVNVDEAATPQEALWTVWQRRMRELAPRRVELDASLEEITSHRIDALLRFYAEDPESRAAGFVTNCHPQDGKQLSNVIQYGFTGQNVGNAFNLLRAAERDDAAENRRRALAVIDFYVEDARRNPNGLVHGLYNMDLGRYDSWWTGLLLPLAYANPGDDLERLMGPLYDHLRPVIERLKGREGTYLRCLAEEYDSLLQAYQIERDRGTVHDDWMKAALSFAHFLAAAQEGDGSFYRCYDLDGKPLTDPDFWFGQTEVQQKSSTATVVGFLIRLHELTGDQQWVDISERACAYVYKEFVEDLKFNGGIHDSMYAKPQLVDHESIIFAFRALLETHRATGKEHYLEQAVRAAWIVCSWAWLWDVPLPAESTYARFGFRTTGWTGCDAPGAGYIHPMGVIVVPDLVEVARRTGEESFLVMAELILAACNENVAIPGKDWGYAFPGLQEEGLQVSWCWADDPMFVSTGFGERWKGEGNKTCFPWISAVTVWSFQEMMARYGTTDVWSAGRRAPEVPVG
jgi:hypothetical protein